MVNTPPPRFSRPQVKSAKSFAVSSAGVLVCSEYVLALLLLENGHWPAGQPFPPEPPDYQANGYIDAGVFLFLLNNPEHLTNEVAKDAAERYVSLLTAVGSLPPTFLTGEIYASLDSLNLIADDGSVVGTGEYELYDQNWVLALANLALCVLADDWEYDYLPTPDAASTTILGQDSNTVCTVGMVSDWGAGNAASQAVMSALAGLSPDCIIHLGDVYYSGVPTDSSLYYYASNDPGGVGEDLENLVDAWPAHFSGPSFTMNSNHEMYTGGQGLFGDALTSQTFSAQASCSMFQITVADWTILGLDSANAGQSENLFMNGNLDPDLVPWGYTSQCAWISSLNLHPEKTIVLTHHNGFDPNCDMSAAVDQVYQPFRQQLYGALGAMPYAWFWGHVHNCIVYERLETNGIAFTPFCRCIGNGSMPYGVAPSLNSPFIEWQAAQTVRNDRQKRLQNGYAMLSFTIGHDGNVARIEENYYTTQSPEAAYSATLWTNH